ncbi:MAG: hypothetical protein PVG65_03435 [Candidatus Thorarchaeota archaeon]|jgi:hypothetical protein
MDDYLKNIQERMDESYIITIECTPQAADETLIPLLNYLKDVAAVGHSFPIIVDPNDKEYKKEFGMDGDGAAHIRSITKRLKRKR